MIRLYFAPRTRSVRILWLLEELNLPYELKPVEFQPTANQFYIQRTPTGKLPTIEDGEVTLFESGAIVEYILERYGHGRLAPALGSKDRAPYLQWLHFAESTAFAPIGNVVWLTQYRADGAEHQELIKDALNRAASGLHFLESALADNIFLLGGRFSAADIMMGFTLWAAKMLQLLDKRYPRLQRYLERLEQRPAFRKALTT